MMGIKERDFRRLPADLSLEVLVPEDNFYRRLEEKIRSLVREGAGAPTLRRRRQKIDRPRGLFLECVKRVPPSRVFLLTTTARCGQLL